MSDIIVIDDFFPKFQQRTLEVETLDRNIPWIYEHTPAYGSSKADYDFMKNDENIVSLNFGIFRYAIFRDKKMISTFYDSHLSNLKSLIEKKFNVEVESFERIYLNFSTPTGTKTEKYGVPHFDTSAPNAKIFIYYINDTDGDTIIFDEFYNGEINSEKKTISQRITPKKSRAVMFDSNRYHAASWPIENTRRIINVNFHVKV
jgi:hypothetical protein